jgi:hypothetical protein
MNNDAIPYEGHALLRLRRERESLIMARQLKRIVIESANVTEVNPRASAPGDARKLRGLPCIAAGVCGEVPGTRPDRAAINHDRSVRGTKYDYE